MRYSRSERVELQDFGRRGGKFELQGFRKTIVVEKILLTQALETP